MSTLPSDPREATAADGQVWRDSLGRTWVALGSPPQRLTDRTIREVASGTRRGAIEWPTGQDAESQGLFAARRALLESLSAGPHTAAAVPRVEGVLVSGNAIVVENPGGALEAWWVDAAARIDRVACWLELMARIARAAGRLVEPAAAEGLVPVVRPRSLRSQPDGRWLVTEFAPLVELPPDLGSNEVLSGFLAPETVQGVPSRDGQARVVWGVGATVLATCAWANASVDGSTGEPIESPAGSTYLGRILSDLHTQGMFAGSGSALRRAFSMFPDPDRLPTQDREAVLRFAEQAEVGRAVGAALIAVLDDALALEPGRRPSPTALAERLEALARDARSAVHPRSVDGPDPDAPPEATAPDPPPEPPKKKPRPRLRRVDSGRERSVRELQEAVAQLRTELEATQATVAALQEDQQARALAQARRVAPSADRTALVALAVGVLVSLGVGLGGWWAPAPSPPERVVVPIPVETGPQSPSGATPVDAPVDPTALGSVAMRGGTVSLSGERGVYGAGVVPPGTYMVVARPLRGPEQDLGEVTVHAGETLTFQCDAGVCARSPD